MLLRKREKVSELTGLIEFYERLPIVRARPGRWRKVMESSNIVVNGFYNDLFSVMTGGGAPSLAISGLALGVQSGTITPARADTKLAVEWVPATTTLGTAIANGATGVVSLAVAATPEPIPSGSNIQLGAGQTVVTSGATVAGATSIPVTSFTASQLYPIGTTVDVTSWTPQRMSVTATSVVTTDPPSATWSFYLASAANQVTVVFTEAGLLYRASSLTPGDVASTYFASHAVFSYTKNTNTDLRIDYTLARALT